MRIDIITIFPGFFKHFFEYSILKKAQEKGKAEIKIYNLRDYSSNKQKSVDDYQFGGGSGMVMNIQPIFNCIEKLKKERIYDEIIYLSPDGEKLNQNSSNSLSLSKNMIFLCGHYKGIDHRIRENLITKEISIGDYVITGGELAACVLADSVIRLIPGVIGNENSKNEESFENGLLEYPQYTKPQIWEQISVPNVLLSGDHAKIKDWRLSQSEAITRVRRPDLWQKYNNKKN